LTHRTDEMVALGRAERALYDQVEEYVSTTYVRPTELEGDAVVAEAAFPAADDVA
jgi:hypothetical protein